MPMSVLHLLKVGESNTIWGDRPVAPSRLQPALLDLL
jgi:hypothetical protein